MSQMRDATFHRVMRSKETKARMERYGHVLAYSRDPLMRALARVAQANLAGLGAILTHEEVRAFYGSLGEQIEATLANAEAASDSLYPDE